MTGKYRSPAAAYAERRALTEEIIGMHEQFYIRHVALDAAQWLRVAELRSDPVVLSDWSLAGPLEDLFAVKRAGEIITGCRVKGGAR